MEYKDKYVEAIQHVHNAILTSDPKYWWPQMTGVETIDDNPDGYVYFVYDLGQGEICSGMGHLGDDYRHARSTAMLRLLQFKEPCTLFAFPLKDGVCNGKCIVKEDIVVGFISGTQNSFSIMPAWNKTRILPLIGNNADDMMFDDPPEMTKWVLCAALASQHRHAVSLFCQGVPKTTQEACTPVLDIIQRVC